MYISASFENPKKIGKCLYSHGKLQLGEVSANIQNVVRSSDKLLRMQNVNVKTCRTEIAGDLWKT